MKRFVLMIISSCVMLFAFAQEEIVLDSIQKIKPELNTRSLNMDPSTLSKPSFSLNSMNQLDKSAFSQPLLPDYTKNLSFLKSINSPLFSSESFSTTGFGFSPYFSQDNVFNQATYHLNDRFSFGGNSYATQSVFDQPSLNSSMQNMNTCGAAMFLQYKVSKNFKVETQINISNHQSPWGP